MALPSTPRPLLLVTLLALTTALTAAGQSERESLFFSSPGEKDRLGKITRRAGLYGGKINAQSPQLARNLFEAGFHCAEYTPDDYSDEFNPFPDVELVDELDIESLSFDPDTGDVLMKTLTEEATHLTVFRGPLCSGVHSCRNNSLQPLFYNVQISDTISPLALRNGRVYFVLTRNVQISRLTMIRTLELRALDDRCKKDFPLDQGSMFEVNECSELITTLEEIEFEKIPPVSATSTLLVLPSETGTNFFVQLLYTKQDANTGAVVTKIVLKRVSPDRKVHDIHTELVDRGYLMYEMQHVGGIAVRGGRICWSAFDCIYCASWDGEQVTDVRMALQKGQASQVCKGPRGEALLANIVTGVAIADATSGDLYFGCIGQIASVGGLGYLRGGQAGRPEIVEVRSNYSGAIGRDDGLGDGVGDDVGDGEVFRYVPGGQRVFAGSLFLTEHCATGYGPNYAEVSGAVGLAGSMAAGLVVVGMQVAVVWLGRLGV